MLRVPVLVLLLTENQDGEIGGGFSSHVRGTNECCRSEGEQSDRDRQGITKQETEKGEGRSWENNGKELGKPARN